MSVRLISYKYELYKNYERIKFGGGSLCIESSLDISDEIIREEIKVHLPNIDFTDITIKFEILEDVHRNLYKNKNYKFHIVIASSTFITGILFGKYLLNGNTV
jgi:hypothetical protein